jgi:hypothetical protein
MNSISGFYRTRIAFIVHRSIAQSISSFDSCLRHQIVTPLYLQLVPYDTVDRNKVSIRQLAFIFLLSHYMFRPLRAIFRGEDTQSDILLNYF